MRSLPKRLGSVLGLLAPSGCQSGASLRMVVGVHTCGLAQIFVIVIIIIIIVIIIVASTITAKITAKITANVMIIGVISITTIVAIIVLSALSWSFLMMQGSGHNGVACYWAVQLFSLLGAAGVSNHSSSDMQSCLGRCQSILFGLPWHIPVYSLSAA